MPVVSERTIQRLRRWYGRLLRLYPDSYYMRCGEGMAQTFTDLLRDRAAQHQTIVGYALWLFVETSARIMGENVNSMIGHKKRFIIMAVAVACLLAIPLIAMQFTDEVNWGVGDFVIMGGLLFGFGMAYEFIARRSDKTMYRVAFGVGLVAAFLLIWVNGAVGIIGNEGQPANLLYGAVFAVGLIGSLMARFKPRGMSVTLFAAALTQVLIPVAALLIWPHVSWGGAGMVGVFFFNGIFVMLFVISGFLFRQAGIARSAQNTSLG